MSGIRQLEAIAACHVIQQDADAKGKLLGKSSLIGNKLKRM
jgi:hypothetical protein